MQKSPQQQQQKYQWGELTLAPWAIQQQIVYI